jgi:HPt (histidine-containing phosphotransfer) domain-containing protein
MDHEGVSPIDLERFEQLAQRLEQAAEAIASSEEKLTRTLAAMRDRDRAAAFDAWRRNQ